ncbi:hypothetical protein BOTBODRAFT_183921 [Botryobasidium botryosum FD-172 SS1]|uniref:RNase III domain-containing protein n=1 Tax=Botryobasidium botryosum (strain FD-172 SS1) TaxID=930990 RepID=A0A067MVY6_BOTB1|nr:hypothetical protein BOTBODRAFT_183921 [Botryobasidium botryosum FD-172 SS1]
MTTSTQILPPLPSLLEDIQHIIFSQHRRRIISFSDEDSAEDFHTCECDRLVVLGETVCQTAITSLLFRHNPPFSPEKFLDLVSVFTSNEHIDGWSDLYNLSQYLHPSSTSDARLGAEEGMNRKLFVAYIGAVFMQNGLVAVEGCIHSLIESRGELNALTGVSLRARASSIGSSTPAHENSPAYSQSANYKRRLSWSSPVLTTEQLISPSASPSHPTIAPPPHTAPRTTDKPLKRSKGSSRSEHAPPPQDRTALAVLNERAAQQRLKPEYAAEGTGPPHQRIWTVLCIVDGMSRGSGTASTKQAAKEEAARAALASLGWTA